MFKILSKKQQKNRKVFSWLSPYKLNEFRIFKVLKFKFAPDFFNIFWNERLIWTWEYDVGSFHIQGLIIATLDKVFGWRVEWALKCIHNQFSDFPYIS